MVFKKGLQECMDDFCSIFISCSYLYTLTCQVAQLKDQSLFV